MTQVATRSGAEPVEGPVDVDEPIEPARVIPPELRFTTADKPLDAGGERELQFELDGEAYTIIRPRKLDEALAQLIEAGARRATTADALYAGQRFLQRVLAPESLDRLQRRLDDDTDPFRITDLYDILERIVKVFDVSGERAPANGPRGRGRRR